MLSSSQEQPPVEEHVYVVLNYACDNKCLFCAVEHAKHNAFDLPVDHYLHELARLPSDRRYTVILSGGEPLLFKGLFELVSYVRRSFSGRIVLYTNGRRLKDESIVREMPGRGIDEVIIPFLSCEESVFNRLANRSTAFAETLEGIRNVDRQGMQYQIKFIPLKLNYRDLLLTYDFCRREFPRGGFLVCGLQYLGEVLSHTDEIAVPYSAVSRELERLLDHAERRGDRSVTISRYPRCTLDAKWWGHLRSTPFSEHTIGPDFSFLGVSYDRSKKYLPDPCQRCAHDCDWHPEHYVSIFGSGELTPVPAAPTV